MDDLRKVLTSLQKVYWSHHIDPHNNPFYFLYNPIHFGYVFFHFDEQDQLYHWLLNTNKENNKKSKGKVERVHR